MANNAFVNGLMRVVKDVAGRAINQALHTNRSRSNQRQDERSDRDPRKPRFRTKQNKRSQSNDRRQPQPADSYPGDLRERPHIVYNPHKDGAPDPGEIVWTWVPYEEDYRQGKDRPVLLIAHDGPWLVGLQITSQDHDRDRDQEARAGRYWIDIGTGEWDHERRPSEARVNRLIRIDPDAVRRVGAILDEQVFNAVAREVLTHY